MPEPASEFTRILAKIKEGDEAAVDDLLAVVYDELRALATDKMRSERAGHTLQPTALVHEAYVRLSGEEKHEWKNRTHFFGAAAEVMRRILVDHARKKAAQKRGGNVSHDPLDSVVVLFEERGTDLIALDESLRKLAAMDSQRATIVELRFFGGLTNDQIASLLEVSTRTVERGWSVARLWLLTELGAEGTAA